MGEATFGEWRYGELSPAAREGANTVLGKFRELVPSVRPGSLYVCGCGRAMVGLKGDSLFTGNRCVFCTFDLEEIHAALDGLLGKFHRSVNFPFYVMEEAGVVSRVSVEPGLRGKRSVIAGPLTGLELPLAAGLIKNLFGMPNETFMKIGLWAAKYRRSEDEFLFLMGVPKAEITEDIRSYASTVLGVYSCWSTSGFPVFHLTSSFMAALLLTDPSGVLLEDFHFPFKTFVIRLPTPFWRTDRGDASIVWVRDKGPEYEAFVSGSGWGISLWDRANAPEPADRTVGKWLGLLYKEIDACPEPGDGTLSRDQTLSKGEKHLSRIVWRLIVNLALYVTERREAVDEEMGRIRASWRKKGKEAEPRQTGIILGREIKLDHRLLEAARAWTGAHKGWRVGWKLQSRHVVIGHRRNQVCGSRKKLPGGKWTSWPGRRPTFVEPHYRGPEGSIVQHTYTLGKGKGNESEPVGGEREEKEAGRKDARGGGEVRPAPEGDVGRDDRGGGEGPLPEVPG